MMVVLVGALFATPEALAKALSGTGGDDMLLGPTETTASMGAETTRSKAAAVMTKSSPVMATTRWTLGRVTAFIYARDTDGVDYMDCGGGFDKIETIHRDDRTKRELATKDWPSVDHYAEAKTEIIEGIISRAAGRSLRED